MKLITAHAAHAIATRIGGATEYSIIDENTGRKIAHVSVRHGYGHVTGVKRTAFEGLTAVVELHGGGGMGSVIEALASKEGLRNGRDDSSPREVAPVEQATDAREIEPLKFKRTSVKGAAETEYRCGDYIIRRNTKMISTLRGGADEYVTFYLSCKGEDLGRHGYLKDAVKTASEHARTGQAHAAAVALDEGREMLRKADAAPAPVDTVAIIWDDPKRKNPASGAEFTLHAIGCGDVKRVRARNARSVTDFADAAAARALVERDDLGDLDDAPCLRKAAAPVTLESKAAASGFTVVRNTRRRLPVELHRDGLMAMNFRTEPDAVRWLDSRNENETTRQADAAPAACLHAGCHPGRCVYGPDHGKPVPAPVLCANDGRQIERRETPKGAFWVHSDAPGRPSGLVMCDENKGFATPAVDAAPAPVAEDITQHPFMIGADHVGDRVTYDGEEYRVSALTGAQTGLVWLTQTASPGQCVQVHVSNTRMAWCPTAHGGKGKPVDA